MFNNIKEFYRGPGLLISTVMWESFSIFGLRALLILYLTQVMAFSDAKAFEIYAGFISLVWVSPVVGGWIADKYLGFKYSVYIGAILIILGHIVLGLTSNNSLYVGLSLLICGMGFFKTNAICMVASYYRGQPEKVSSMMTLYYVGMNVGGTLGPIVCAYLQKDCGYSCAFLAAAIGMTIGLIILTCNRKRFENFANPIISNNECWKKGLLAVFPFIAIVISLSLILKYNVTSYLLSACFIAAAYMLWKNIQYLAWSNKKNLLILLGFTLVATFFWILDQQGGSSMSLYILRNVNRVGIPTAAFQAINPFVIIVVGLASGLFLQKNNNEQESNKMISTNKVNLLSLLKIMLGVSLLTAGYTIITISAALSAKQGMVSFWLPVIGLSLIGSAEIFIDPVILSSISLESPKELLGLLTAIYYLFVGALANFLSGKVAILSAVPLAIAKSSDIRLSGQVYFKTFGDITEACIIVLVLLALALLLIFFKRNLSKLNRIQNN